MSVPHNLDANATSKVLDPAMRAYAQAARDARGGKEAGARIREAALIQTAKALGAAPEEVFFTAGGTEADRLALLLAARESPGTPPRGVLSALEHSAVAGFAAEAAAHGGFTSSRWPATAEGRLVCHPGADVLALGVGFFSVLLAHNETGVVQPLAEVVATAKALGAWVHTDAVQAAGRLDIDFQALGVDLLALAGHKIGAVGGVGALLVRRGTALHARLRAALADAADPCAVRTGWLAHSFHAQVLLLQEAQANVPGIASFAAALDHLPAAAARQTVARQRDAFEAHMLAALGPGACRVLGQGAPRLVNTSALHLVGIEAEAVLMALDMAGFAISAGAACASGALEPSPSLRAMGMGAQQAREVVRISLPSPCDDALLLALGSELVAIVRRVGAQGRGSVTAL